MKKLRELLSILHGRGGVYALAILAISLGTLFSYIAPLVVRTTIDSLLNNEPLNSGQLIDRLFISLGGVNALRERLYIPALFFAALVAIQGVFTFFAKYLASSAAEKSVESLRNELFRHIQRQKFSYFATAKTGDIIQRCTSDMDTLRIFLETQFIELGNTCVMIVIALALMFSIHVPLALVTLPIIPFTIIFSFVFLKKMEKSFGEQDECEGRLSQMLSEQLRAVRVVKSFAREEHEIQRFEGKNTELRGLVQKNIDLLAIYWSVETGVSTLQSLLVVALGAVWAVQGSVTIGTLQVFIVYLWMIIWPLRQMGRILVDMSAAFVGIRRINTVRAEVPEDMHEDGSRKKISPKIEFRALSFAYPPAKTSEEDKEENDLAQAAVADAAVADAGVTENEERETLHSLSFSIEPGERIGILGPTGSGKSTILHLLAGFYENYSGEIIIDGQPLKSMHLPSYRKQIAFVLQEPLLFSGSVKTNIRMGREEASYAGIQHSARLAEIHDSIQEFKQGYHTIVGERGITLSGGQKQRVAIARALVRNAVLYMFDDSLSALDAETDARIRDNLALHEADATCIIVSHRLSTVAACDRIFIIESGRLSQAGSHEELLATEGLYKRLWNLQEGRQKI